MLMKKHLTNSLSTGRPKGAKSFNHAHAKAFGIVLRQTRIEKEVSQEKLGHIAGIERAHVGKIERGEHIPSLSIVLMLSVALGVPASELVAQTERLLAKGDI